MDTKYVHLTAIITVGLFAISFIVSVWHFNVINSTHKWRVYERAVIEKGIHPLTLECVERPWDGVETYNLCEKAITASGMTREELDQLSNELSKR